MAMTMRWDCDECGAQISDAQRLVEVSIVSVEGRGEGAAVVAKELRHFHEACSPIEVLPPATQPA